MEAEETQTAAVDEEDEEQGSAKSKQHKTAQTARTPRKKSRERQRGEIKKRSLVGKVGAREVVIGRKMAAVDTETEGEMKSVPRGSRVLTNTEKEFYKQQ